MIIYQSESAAIIQTAMGGVGVFFDGQAAPPKKDTEPRHTPIKVKPLAQGAEIDVSYAHWGSNNLFAQQVIKEMDKSGVGKAGLRTRAKAHYGGGPRLFTGDSPATDMAVEAWLRANKVPRVQRELINGYEWWGMCLPEFVVSNDASSILSVRPVKPAYTRLSLHDEETGRSEWAVINPNWELGSMAYTRIVPVADPWWSADELREKLLRTGHRKFILPSWIPDPDMGYYPTMDWHATYLSGWLQQTNSIPAFKKAWMENAAGMRWQVKIPIRYYEAKYKDTWATMKESEKQEKIKETFTAIDNFLKGAENAGKSIVTHYEVDEMGNQLPGWEFVDLNQGFRDGQFIPDSEKGNSEILAAMAVDPTLLGQGAPGGKLGAGSGSDKREAIVILQALQTMDRDHTTEWFQLVRDFNRWSPELRLGYDPMPLPVMDMKQPTTAPAPAPEPTPEPQA